MRAPEIISTFASSELAEDRIHVWRADLDELKETFSADEVLSQRERLNAARFVRALDARRYRYGRALLRGLIAKYLAMNPAVIVLDESETGKPCLPIPAPLHFSVSHCDNTWYLAISRYGPIGIDVEREHDIEDVSAISLSIMTKQERLAFLRVPPEQQGSVFLRCWTRKEALIKAIGIGLAAADLRSLHVGITALPIQTTAPLMTGPMLVRSFQTDLGETIGLATHVNATRVEFRHVEIADTGWLMGAENRGQIPCRIGAANELVVGNHPERSTRASYIVCVGLSPPRAPAR